MSTVLLSLRCHVVVDNVEDHVCQSKLFSAAPLSWAQLCWFSLSRQHVSASEVIRHTRAIQIRLLLLWWLLLLRRLSRCFSLSSCHSSSI